MAAGKEELTALKIILWIYYLMHPDRRLELRICKIRSPPSQRHYWTWHSENWVKQPSYYRLQP